MFSEKKENQSQVLERNIISKNTEIIGEIISEGDFRIDGKVDGTIKTSGRVVIGTTGIVKGKVDCAFADIEGNFSGELNVSALLTLKASSNVSGDVIVSKLSVEPGASFNATCSMKGNVKGLNHGKSSKEKTA